MTEISRHRSDGPLTHRSWWLTAERSAFTATAGQEVARMHRSKFSSYVPVSLDRVAPGIPRKAPQSAAYWQSED